MGTLQDDLALSGDEEDLDDEDQDLGMPVVLSGTFSFIFSFTELSENLFLIWSYCFGLVTKLCVK